METEYNYIGYTGEGLHLNYYIKELPTGGFSGFTSCSQAKASGGSNFMSGIYTIRNQSVYSLWCKGN